MILVSDEMQRVAPRQSIAGAGDVEGQLAFENDRPVPPRMDERLITTVGTYVNRRYRSSAPKRRVRTGYAGQATGRRAACTPLVDERPG